MWLTWIIAAADSGLRSESLLVRRARPFHAFVRSTTQRLRTGVNPLLSSGRAFTSILQPGRFVANQASSA